MVYRKFKIDFALNTKQECPSKCARACRVKLRDYQFVWSAPSGSNWMIIRFVLSKVNNGRNKRIYALGLRPFEPLDDFTPTLSYQIDKVCSKSIRSTCSLLWSWNFFLHNSVTHWSKIINRQKRSALQPNFMCCQNGWWQVGGIWYDVLSGPPSTSIITDLSLFCQQSDSAHNNWSETRNSCQPEQNFKSLQDFSILKS